MPSRWSVRTASAEVGLTVSATRDHAGQFAVDGDEHRGLGVRLQLIHRRPHRRDVDARLREEALIADDDRPLADRALHAADRAPRSPSTLLGQIEAALGRRVHDRLRQRVLGALLDDRDEAQQIIFAPSRSRG